MRVRPAAFPRPQGIYVGDAIEDPEADFEGLRFRVYNDATAAFAQRIGAEPTRIEAAAVPTAFATGLVGAMITSAQTGVDSAAWDFVEHYYDTQAMHPDQHDSGCPSKDRQSMLCTTSGREPLGIRRTKRTTNEQQRQQEQRHPSSSIELSPNLGDERGQAAA